MPWNSYTDCLLSEAELEEPDRLIDALTDIINADNDNGEMARWAVESLAEAVGLQVQIGSDDPLQRFRQFAETTEACFLWAGGDLDLRGALAAAAGRHARVLMSIAEDWGVPEPMEERDLEREWGPLTKMSSERRPSITFRLHPAGPHPKSRLLRPRCTDD